MAFRPDDSVDRPSSESHPATFARPARRAGRVVGGRHDSLRRTPHDDGTVTLHGKLDVLRARCRRLIEGGDVLPRALADLGP